MLALLLIAAASAASSREQTLEACLAQNTELAALNAELRATIEAQAKEIMELRHERRRLSQATTASGQVTVEAGGHIQIGGGGTLAVGPTGAASGNAPSTAAPASQASPPPQAPPPSTPPPSLPPSLPPLTWFGDGSALLTTTEIATLRRHIPSNFRTLSSTPCYVGTNGGNSISFGNACAGERLMFVCRSKGPSGSRKAWAHYSSIVMPANNVALGHTLDPHALLVSITHDHLLTNDGGIKVRRVGSNPGIGFRFTNNGGNEIIQMGTSNGYIGKLAFKVYSSWVNMGGFAPRIACEAAPSSCCSYYTSVSTCTTDVFGDMAEYSWDGSSGQPRGQPPDFEVWVIST